MTSTFIPNGPTPKPTPGGWIGAGFAESPEAWRVPTPPDVRADLLRAAVDVVSAGGVGGDDPLQPRPAVSAQTRSLIAELQRRLAGEPGFVVLSDFPVEEEPELVEAAYWVVGLLLGRPPRQNVMGELIARVENVGRDPHSGGGQGW